jgi:lysophospholipase L1-like esterase
MKNIKKSVFMPPLMFVTVVSVILASFGCNKEQTTALPTNPPVMTDTTKPVLTGPTLKYLALGDSYTIGQSVTAEARFPAQTVQILKSSNINITTTDYIAVTGWTTTNLMSAITSQNPAANYDIVTLLIGVNDQYQHLDTAGYRTRFTQLLNKAVTLAANRVSRVIVLSIPDYSATPFVGASDKARVSMEIDAFNAINKQITIANNIAYLDITPSTRQAQNDQTLVAIDNLHPSGTEYRKWAVMLAPIIQKALQ